MTLLTLGAIRDLEFVDSRLESEPFGSPCCVMMPDGTAFVAVWMQGQTVDSSVDRVRAWSLKWDTLETIWTQDYPMTLNGAALAGDNVFGYLIPGTSHVAVHVVEVHNPVNVLESWVLDSAGTVVSHTGVDLGTDPYRLYIATNNSGNALSTYPLSTGKVLALASWENSYWVFDGATIIDSGQIPSDTPERYSLIGAAFPKPGGQDKFGVNFQGNDPAGGSLAAWVEIDASTPSAVTYSGFLDPIHYGDGVGPSGNDGINSGYELAFSSPYLTRSVSDVLIVTDYEVELAVVRTSDGAHLNSNVTVADGFFKLNGAAVLVEAATPYLLPSGFYGCDAPFVESTGPSRYMTGGGFVQMGCNGRMNAYYVKLYAMDASGDLATLDLPFKNMMRDGVPDDTIPNDVDLYAGSQGMDFNPLSGRLIAGAGTTMNPDENFFGLRVYSVQVGGKSYLRNIARTDGLGGNAPRNYNKTSVQGSLRNFGYR